MTDELADRCVLHCLDGPERSTIVVEPGQAVVLGRLLDCDVVLADPSVSRRHARIARHGDAWTVTDLGSSHGTLINRVRIEAERPVIVMDGDVVTFGPWRYRVRLGRPRQSTVATLSDAGGETEEVHDIGSLASRRLAARQLDALIESAASLTEAENESALATLLLPALLTGSGFRRAALLRMPDGNDASAECVAVEHAADDRPAGGEDSAEAEHEEAPFSRSLLRAAAAGMTVRLQRAAEGVADWGQSIAEAGVTAAICSPVHIGPDVVAYLYVDSTAGGAAREEPAEPFCHAMARLFGLALANISRRDLQERSRRIEAHLSAAHEAQRLIVPAADGELGRLRWSMRMRPGHYVAGDLFDIIELPDDAVGVCIGDVTGEGIDAAVLMAAAQAHLHASLRQSGDPGVAVRMVNEYLADHSPPGRFVTLWVGVIEADGRLRYVDAGHGHWMHVSNGEILAPDERGGIPLGIDRGFPYQSVERALQAGDRLVLYTDGVIEQRNGGGEEFNRRQLMELVKQGTGPADDLRRIMQAVESWSAMKAFDDDVTVASLRFAHLD